MTVTRLDLLRQIDACYAEMKQHQYDPTRVGLLTEEIVRLRAEEMHLAGTDKPNVLDLDPGEPERRAAWDREHDRIRAADAALHTARLNHTITDAEFETKRAALMQREHALSPYATWRSDGAAPPPTKAPLMSPFEESENA